MAKFSITNTGAKPITFDKLLVGGRSNEGKLPDGSYPDFTPQLSVTLDSGQMHNYEGALKLKYPGNYHFFCTYYIETPTPEEKELLDDNNWNSNIALGAGLTANNGTKQIKVKD